MHKRDSWREVGSRHTEKTQYEKWKIDVGRVLIVPEMQINPEA